jgi:hypothetical protein
MTRIILFLLLAITIASCKKTKQTSSTEVPQETPNETVKPTKQLPEHTKTAINGDMSTIRGKIITTEKEPLAYATFVLTDSNNKKYGVYTDIDGNFELKNIPNGKYVIQISFVGFETQTYGPLQLNAAYEITFEMIEAKELEIILLKPIIYLYPTDTIGINVQIDYEGDLIHTYPKYGIDGWNMTCYPNGTLIDQNGRSYYALYWEGKQHYGEMPQCGQVIRADQSISFLETSLETLGLTQREANEFIMYWLPILEQHPYSLIHFSTVDYNRETPLRITPRPDQVIRVMMTVVPLDAPIDYPKQQLSAPKPVRSGFTVVEWGGQIRTLQELIDTHMN